MQHTPHKPVIGLLGGVGSGKSHVAGQFASLGCAVIDADAIARHVLEEPAIVAAIRGRFGDGVIAGDGSVDRKALAAIVFADEAARGHLEALVHPRVHARRAELRERYQADPEVVAIIEDTPLILEQNLARECDALVMVACDPATRYDRVRRTRNWSREQWQARESSQAPLDIKEKTADYVVDNNGDPAVTLTHVKRVLSQILQQQGRPDCWPDR